MMLLVDQGNSRIKLGIWDTDVVESRSWAHNESPRAVADLLRGHDVERIVGVSVTPSLRDPLDSMIESQCGRRTEWVDHTWNFPFSVKEIDRPESVGADRWALSSGAMKLSPDSKAWVVVGVGTAITVDVVAGGSFLGGSILPGPGLFLESLSRSADRIPDTRGARYFRDQPWGNDTRSALESGASWGSLGAIQALVDRARNHLGIDPDVIVSGGLGEAWAARMRPRGAFVEHLAFQGLTEIARLNPRPETA